MERYALDNIHRSVIILPGAIMYTHKYRRYGYRVRAQRPGAFTFVTGLFLVTWAFLTF